MERPECKLLKVPEIFKLISESMQTSSKFHIFQVYKLKRNLTMLTIVKKIIETEYKGLHIRWPPYCGSMSSWQVHCMSSFLLMAGLFVEEKLYLKKETKFDETVLFHLFLIFVFIICIYHMKMKCVCLPLLWVRGVVSFSIDECHKAMNVVIGFTLPVMIDVYNWCDALANLMYRWKYQRCLRVGKMRKAPISILTL